MPFAAVSQAHSDLYQWRMAQSLHDKLFFLDRVDLDIYVDFGCADGALLEAIHAEQPRARLFGFDLDELAAQRARQKLPFARFFSDLSDLEREVSRYKGNQIGLIASSVVHEVYAYGGEEAGKAFWQHLRTGPYTHFLLRDMALADIDAFSFEPELAALVRARSKPELIADFEEIWGSIDSRRNLVHFLLKYRYEDNWQREVAENYLPLTHEETLREIGDGFRTTYSERQVLPYLAERLNVDLGLSFPCPTHHKLIVERTL